MTSKKGAEARGGEGLLGERLNFGGDDPQTYAGGSQRSKDVLDAGVCAVAGGAFEAVVLPVGGHGQVDLLGRAVVEIAEGVLERRSDESAKAAGSSSRCRPGPARSGRRR